MGPVRFFLVAACLTSPLGCSGDDELECASIDPACTPLYAPTWDNVFANTLRPKCGTGGGACHQGTAARGGLRLDDEELAYQNLMRPTENWIDLADVGCGEVISRLYTSSSRFRMPRGSTLSQAERCAVTQWALAGAPGPIDGGLIDAGVSDAMVSP